MSILKKKIRVNYEDVQIDLVSPSNDNDDHYFGEYDSVKNIIQLDKTQSSRSLANSLLHEVLHSVIYHTGLNSDGNCLAADKDEELVVNNLTNTLSQIDAIQIYQSKTDFGKHGLYAISRRLVWIDCRFRSNPNHAERLWLRRPARSVRSSSRTEGFGSF